jgi:hypothetical protein
VLKTSTKFMGAEFELNILQKSWGIGYRGRKFPLSGAYGAKIETKFRKKVQALGENGLENYRSWPDGRASLEKTLHFCYNTLSDLRDLSGNFSAFAFQSDPE